MLMEKLNNGSEKDESPSSFKYHPSGSEIEVFNDLNPQVSFQIMSSLEIHML